jgi:hypothetical protein
MDFELLKNLLRILVLLWFTSDYHAAQDHGDVSKIDMNTDIGARSFHWLQEVFDKLSAQSEHNISYDYKTCHTFIVGLLSYRLVFTFVFDIYNTSFFKSLIDTTSTDGMAFCVFSFQCNELIGITKQIYRCYCHESHEGRTMLR